MSLPQWKGLWDWSMRYNDGTRPSNFRKEDIDMEKMKWLDNVLKEYMQDFAARMKEIKAKLDQDTSSSSGSAAAQASDSSRDQGPGAAAAAAGRLSEEELQEREALLEELMDIVSSIDYARDLHKIGGLPTMLELLEGPYPSLTSRAAEVIATCVQNNTPVQQWFLEGGVLLRLLALLGPERTADERVKALLAVSSLIRHFGPGLEAFRAADGLRLLVACLGTQDRRLRRKAMTTLQYVLSKKRSDSQALLTAQAPTPGAAVDDEDDITSTTTTTITAAANEASAALPLVTAALAEPDDSDLRQAALGLLLEVCRCGPLAWSAVRELPGLASSTLPSLQESFSQLSGEDKEAQGDELELVRELQGVLSLSQAPQSTAEVQDDISPAQYDATSGREQQTMTVNNPASTAARTATSNGDSAPAKDTGSAAQGAAVAGTAARLSMQQGTGVQSQGAGTAAPPLLLGPPPAP